MGKMAMNMEFGQSLNQLMKKVEVAKGAIHARQIMLDTAMQTNPRVQKRMQKGLNVRGQKIRPYSEEPMYVSKKTPGGKGFVKPIGKYGQRVFKNNKRHRSMYMPEGYSQWRRVAGRSTTEGRFSFTNRMFLSMLAGIYGRAGAMIQISRQAEAAKMAGNQKRFGQIWGLTKQERSFAAQYCFTVASRAIKEALK